MSNRNFFLDKRKTVQYQHWIDNIVFTGAIIGFVLVFIDVGGVNSAWHWLFDVFYQVSLVVFFVLFAFRAYLDQIYFKKKRERWLVVLEVISLLLLLLAQWDIVFASLGGRQYLQLAISAIFIIEISKRSLALEKLKVNPGLLFIFSFLLLIIIGALALMLPISTVSGHFGFVDALFTSTSAVCVTGLGVVDTGTYFTRFGQDVLLVLISLGGLGVMTFTSFFGFFFKGETSFRNQMIYKDFTGEDNLKNVFSTIIKVVTFTIGVEIVGALLLFSSLSPADFQDDWGKQAYFSIFHSISAFNNAGFQLKSNGLYDATLHHNHVFQTVIAVLIIFGGLGFYISFNIIKYLGDRIKIRARNILFGDTLKHTPWVLNFNSRIVLRTTFILLLVGTIVFYFTEYNGTIKDHWGPGKVLSAFFLSVTPRTAGFNNIDMTALSREGMLVTILLMWIGASPGSTGGGIKTTTFAVATLGIFNVARGRKNVEFAKREVAQESLYRAFVVICLSLIFLGFSSLLVSYFNPEITLDKLVFECFSAYGTVGLSMGITSQLSTESKIVIIFTMFVGRVGALTFLMAVLRKAVDNRFYRYPSENVIIT